MDDKQFLNGLAKELAKEMEAHSMIAGFVELRELYNNFLSIADDEQVNEAERKEAQEFTEGGFYTFIHRLMQMAGNA